MANNTGNDSQSNKYRRVIVILTLLLILCMTVLAGRYLYLNHFQDNNTATVPQNIIGDSQNTDQEAPRDAENSEASGTESGVWEYDGGSAIYTPSGSNNTNDSSQQSQAAGGSDKDKEKVQAPTISLDKKNPDDNKNFQVSNMLPGDSVTEFYCVKTNHDFDIKVYFESKVTEETKNLGEVLKLKVTDVTAGADKGQVVAEGTFKELHGKSFPVQLKKNSKGYTRQYYRIDVYLDTSVGNPYQAAKLTASFKWYVTDEEYNALNESKPIIPGFTDKDDTDGARTGDSFDRTIWFIFIGSAIALLILLLSRKTGKESE